MYYCFVIEDIKNIEETDPLMLQVNYAELLGQCVYCSIKDKKVFNKNNEELSLKGELVFLRSTYDKYQEAAQIILKQSGKLKETKEDISIIENWTFYLDTIRRIECVDIKDIYSDFMLSKIKELAHNKEYIFIKSIKKGFSAIVSLKKILDKNKDLYIFLKDKCNKCDCNQLLISEYYEIKKDALGKKEARFFVMENKILNCSRNLHSLKHTVSKKMVENAKKIINRIKEDGILPENYILDIVEFIGEEGDFIDIMELNPLTTSMCYVNNSIFDIPSKEISFITKKLGMGYEYCYDYLINGNRYVLNKYVGENYEYKNEEHYKLC